MRNPRPVPIPREELPANVKRLSLLYLTCLPALLAQAEASLDERLASLEQAAQSAQMAGDNAWMLVSCALVLLMTGPGLALFYGGLVRRKNVLSTLMHSFALMALASVLWVLYGYSLAFGDGNSFIGGAQYLLLKGVGMDADSGYAPVPHLTFMAFQMMFAIITPALISGAYAERIRFSAMLVYTTLWLTIVYFPMAHMVWGRGGLMNPFEGGALPCFDFAGGTVVHITSGVSALVAALYLKPRQGYGQEPMKPHNLIISLTGACLLWVGWFGFNAGSALSAGGAASNAFVTTHLGASAATIGWLLAEWLRHGKPSMLGGISGAVAGLVTITPAAGYVTPMAALVIGFLGGVFCFWMVTVVKMKLGYDDSLDAFGIHGAGGFLGAVLTGVFATNLINSGLAGPDGKPSPLGLIDGNAFQIVNQTGGALLAVVLGAVGSYICLKIADLVCGLRVSQEQEIEGLDLSLHGEDGYSLES
ncbi:MAG TPA: ammonia channel protein [Solibacterales bacterium]|nr:ammonia channel protein [Bryobacterales bacterium]